MKNLNIRCMYHHEVINNEINVASPIVAWEMCINKVSDS